MVSVGQLKDIWKNRKKPTYWLTRFVFLRLLGFVYFFAFLSLAMQVIPLIGEDGLLPAENFLDSYGSKFESNTEAFTSYPTMFWFTISDDLLIALSWMGVILSLCLLFGYANIPLLFILWFVYLSFAQIGQLFYGYGWESQLLETGFIALFLVPLWNPKPFPKFATPVPIIWLLRWLTFRINIGAGMIKLKGATCWKDLTCLFYHYETQPIPNPLSPYFHFLPKIFHKASVIITEVVQLIVPWFVFGPKTIRHIAGFILAAFQLTLILSGNLSFLNWITIVAILGCFDDSFFKRILPKILTKKADHAEKHKTKPSRLRNLVIWTFFALVLFLSIPVVQNLMSERQAVRTPSFYIEHY